jgi:putative (di)nucleoside polyphosphate hydrolase
MIYILCVLDKDEGNVSFDVTGTPEFDAYKWVYYWLPIKKIVAFKRQIYRRALKEFSPILFKRTCRIKYPYCRRKT